MEKHYLKQVCGTGDIDAISLPLHKPMRPSRREAVHNHMFVFWLLEQYFIF